YMEKPYQLYSLEELLTDADFRNWVLHPTPESNTFWQAFLQKNPEKTALIEEAKQTIQGIHNYFGQKKTDPAKLKDYFLEVSQRADLEIAERSKIASIRPMRFSRLAVAVSIFLLAGFTGWFLISLQNNFEIHKTVYGEWKTIDLPDGSIVKLNANSELRFAEKWEAAADREVWLEGEAFFEVEKKPATGAKFMVKTQGVSVEVLGTSFNVNSRNKETEVFLEEGKIKLNAGETETFMVPGDLIAYSDLTKEIIENRKGVNDIHSSWKDGVLILQQKSAEEIFNKMKDIYGVEFQVKDSLLLESKTTVRIPMDKLEIAVPILERALNVEILREGNQLQIK
ncbi:MAG: FecR family protein, partial [Bacteroidota bacterium]